MLEDDARPPFPLSETLQADQRTSPWMAFCRSISFRSSWVAAPVELVRAVADAVRPRDQKLAPPRRRELVCRIAVEDFTTRGRVPPQAGPDLGHDRLLIAEESPICSPEGAFAAVTTLAYHGTDPATRLGA